MNSPTNNHKATQNRCPLCDADIRVDSTALFGDFECPECNEKLWFLTAADSARFFEHESSRELQGQAIGFIAQRMEVDEGKLREDPSILNDLETDSLEALELLMDLEEELGLV